jgi:mutator protein MutT
MRSLSRRVSRSCAASPRSGATSPALAVPVRNTSNVTANCRDAGTVTRDGVVEVVVGLLEDGSGRWLVNQRSAGTHMAGAWEFPGGKRHRGELPFAALSRELHEELAIAVTSATPLIEVRHEYVDRRVRLDAWVVTGYGGIPVANEGQVLRWVSLEELDELDLLVADRPIVDALAERINSSRA